MCISAVEFGRLQVWVQVHGMSLQMLNEDNAVSVAQTIGKCIAMDSEVEMQKLGYLRLKVEVDVELPLNPGFWWTDDARSERWEKIRYERLTDYCYGYRTIGHSAQVCNRDIILSE